ncbi:putative transcription factor C2H2 family [Dioscorea sansibarensis]
MQNKYLYLIRRSSLAPRTNSASLLRSLSLSLRPRVLVQFQTLIPNSSVDSWGMEGRGVIEEIETERRMGRGSCKWRCLKERLGLKGVIGCCSGPWGLPSEADRMAIERENEVGGEEAIAEVEDREPAEEMNLAAALAAERQYRGEWGEEGASTPMRVSLMRLLEEGEEEEEEEEGEAEAVETVEACCVCMGRRKGAAFIPCGHTFCRVCCRDLWLNRGSCPLCNRAIAEILDIF